MPANQFNDRSNGTVASVTMFDPATLKVVKAIKLAVQNPNAMEKSRHLKPSDMRRMRMQTIPRLVRTFECSGVSVSRLLAVSAVIGLATMSLHAQHKAYHETNHATLEPGIPAYTPVKGLSGELVSVGADTMESLMKLWIEDFDKVYPDVHFTMEAKASGTAGPALTAGRAQLGPVAREMLPAEEDAFKQKYGYEPLAIAVAGGSYRTPGSTPVSYTHLTLPTICSV